VPELISTQKVYTVRLSSSSSTTKAHGHFREMFYLERQTDVSSSILVLSKKALPSIVQ
jgi:hypothetical protein